MQLSLAIRSVLLWVLSSVAISLESHILWLFHNHFQLICLPLLKVHLVSVHSLSVPRPSELDLSIMKPGEAWWLLGYSCVVTKGMGTPPQRWSVETEFSPP